MLKIVKANVSHADQIQEVTQRAFELYKSNLDVDIELSGLTESKHDIIADIQKNFVYIAEFNGDVLGCVRIKRLSKDEAYLYRFAVDTDEQHKGVGAELLSHVIRQCKEQGYKKISLHTNSKYYRLARYYYGNGFYVHSTDDSQGYIRALFIRELV